MGTLAMFLMQLGRDAEITRLLFTGVCGVAVYHGRALRKGCTDHKAPQVWSGGDVESERQPKGGWEGKT